MNRVEKEPVALIENTHLVNLMQGSSGDAARTVWRARKRRAPETAKAGHSRAA